MDLIVHILTGCGAWVEYTHENFLTVLHFHNITFFETLPEVDPERIGLWGTSFGGANAVTTAAIDDRVKCLSVQITFGSGERMVTGDMNDVDRQKMLATLKKAWQRAVVRNKPMHLNMDQILTDPESKAFYQKTVEAWEEAMRRVGDVGDQTVVAIEITADGKIKIECETSLLQFMENGGG